MRVFQWTERALLASEYSFAASYSFRLLGLWRVNTAGKVWASAIGRANRGSLGRKVRVKGAIDSCDGGMSHCGLWLRGFPGGRPRVGVLRVLGFSPGYARARSAGNGGK